MAVLYTPEEMQEVLRRLRIKPLDGTVTTNEAAKMLTWRAKEEQGIDFLYNASAVRRHIQLGNLRAIPVSTRQNRYRVEDIFEVPLAPRRGFRTDKSADLEQEDEDQQAR